VIDKATDRVIEAVLLYYDRVAHEKEPPKLPNWWLNEVSFYMAATASCELRHISNKCKSIVDKGFPIAIYALENLIKYETGDSHQDRKNVAYEFRKHCRKYDLNSDYHLWFLEGASYVFAGDWRDSFGGSTWSSCCTHASNWIKDNIENGIAPIMSWERWLYACHNNGRWLSKLGDANLVLKAMNLGAQANAKEIKSISNAWFKGDRSGLRHYSPHNYGSKAPYSSGIIEGDYISMKKVKEIYEKGKIKRNYEKIEVFEKEGLDFEGINLSELLESTFEGGENGSRESMF
jgi:hypothetical protein